MPHLDLKNVMISLNLVKEVEMAVSEFYKLSSQVMEKHKTFWNDLSQAEIIHSQNIDKVASLISKNPNKYVENKEFERSRIESLLFHVEEGINQIRNGKLSGNKIFFVAKDIEKSIIESKYGEIVKSSEAEYLNIFREILRQTILHNEIIESRMKELNI